MTSQMSGSKIEWYLAREGRQHGPLGDIEMTKFLELGHLRPGDLVWQAGFAEWRPATDVFDLNEKTLIHGRKTNPTAEIRASAPTAPAVEVQPAELKPVVAAVNNPIGADATDGDINGAKTGIGAKKPLETPLLTPLFVPAKLSQSTIAAQPDVVMEGSYGSEIPQSVTSLNERLQRAATERSTPAPRAPTQPIYSNWPQTELPRPDPQPIGPLEPRVGPMGAANTTDPQPGPTQPGSVKMQPLRELRSVAPVPLVPLEAHTVAATHPQAGPAGVVDARPKRKKEPKPKRTSLNPDHGRGRGRSVGIGLTLAIIVSGGAWLAYSSRDALKSTIGIATQTDSSTVGSATETAAPARIEVVPSPASAFGQLGKPTPFQTSAKTAELIDADLKRSAVWQLISREFPEWHRDRVTELAKLAVEKRDAGAISKYIAESLVSLRRKFADQSLAASPDKLRAVAIAFLENLRQLSAQSIDACYGFISQGETYPAVIDLMRQGDRTEALHKQVVAVFEAVAAGRKSPQTHLPPRKSDYDVLASELTGRGWSQSDLQMFSDAKALAAAPPEQVCKMVQDWFAAQVMIKDPAIQQRLLIESLRPVVAG